MSYLSRVIQRTMTSANVLQSAINHNVGATSSSNSATRIIQNDKGIWSPSPNKTSVIVSPAGEKNQAQWQVYRVKVTGQQSDFCCVFGFKDSKKKVFYIKRGENDKLTMSDESISLNKELPEDDPRIFQDKESPLAQDGGHRFHTITEPTKYIVAQKRSPQGFQLLMSKNEGESWDLGLPPQTEEFKKTNSLKKMMGVIGSLWRTKQNGEHP